MFSEEPVRDRDCRECIGRCMNLPWADRFRKLALTKMQVCIFTFHWSVLLNDECLAFSPIDQAKSASAVLVPSPFVPLRC